jgi:16S rRNA processing protein RimM
VSASERPTLEVGRIIKAQGLKGQVLVDFWTDRVSERIAPGTELITERGVLIVKAGAKHQQRYIVSFEGTTTREQAEALRGLVLSAPGLEDDDAIWIDELFNAEVFDQDGILRGKVKEVEENPASDILILDTGFLVPLAFVVEVEANTRIDIEAPKGLFEDED